jgi:hypothetical protein
MCTGHGCQPRLERIDFTRISQKSRKMETEAFARPARGGRRCGRGMETRAAVVNGWKRASFAEPTRRSQKQSKLSSEGVISCVVVPHKLPFSIHVTMAGEHVLFLRIMVHHAIYQQSDFRAQCLQDSHLCSRLQHVNMCSKCNQACRTSASDILPRKRRPS